MWIKIILSILLLISVLLIIDARPIVRRFFTNSDRNSAVLLLKVLGTILLIISIVLFSLV